MPRKLITLGLLLVTLTACSPQDAGVDTAQALQLADEMRAGCVTTNLDMMLALADRIAPLCEARDIQHLIDLASEWCTVLPGEDLHTLECSGLQLGGDTVDLVAEIEYIGADGTIVSDPRDAVSLRAMIRAAGLRAETTGVLLCTPDPARGLVLEGELVSVLADGCTVRIELNQLTAQRLADATTTLLVTSGSVDIAVHELGVPIATGTAAIVGRNALVALEVGGIFSQGEIALGQQPE